MARYQCQKYVFSQYFDIYTDIKLSVVTFMRWQWNFTVTLRKSGGKCHVVKSTFYIFLSKEESSLSVSFVRV